MRTRIFSLGMLLLLGAAAAITAQTKTAADRLADADVAARKGGPETPIPIYESVCRDFPNDRPSCTKALMRIVKSYDYLENADKVRESCMRLEAQRDHQSEVTPDVQTRCAPSKPRTRLGIFVAEMDPQTGVFQAPAHIITEDAESVETSPSFSPDGQLLALRRYPSSATQAGIDKNAFTATLHVRSLANRTDRMINKCGEAYAGRSFWLPDSKFLLSISRPGSGNTCIYRSDVQTGLVLPPTSNYGDMPSAWSALSPDGTILYTASPLGTDGTNFQLIVIAVNPITGIPIEGQGYALPFSTDSQTTNRNLPLIGLSPDGRTAAMLRGTSTSESRLVRFDTDGSDRHYQVLVTGEGQMENVVWSKDGKRIFFAESSDGNVWQIMQVSATFGGLPSFTGLEVTGLRYFDINRDNTQIAFDGLSYTISAPGSYTRQPAVEAPPSSVPALPPANGPVPTGGGARGAR